jgi:hypothetical protein
MMDLEPFDWERDYGPLYRACPSAFWLAPEPGERKRDVIDVRPKYALDQRAIQSAIAQQAQLSQLAMLQSQVSPYAHQGLLMNNQRLSFYGGIFGNPLR